MRVRLPELTWRPAVWTKGDLVALKVGLAVAAAMRGLDYASSARGDVGAIETAMPLAAWAALCLSITGLILTGITIRMHVMIWTGHCVGLVTYTGLMIGAVLNSFDGWPPVDRLVAHAVPEVWWLALCVAVAAPPIIGALLYRGRRINPWAAGVAVALACMIGVLYYVPLDGIRGAMPLAVIGWVHALFVLRLGIRPLPAQGAHTDGIILAPGK